MVAFEELRKVSLKRQLSLHVIVVPKLITLEWLKHLYRLSDIIMAVPARLDCLGSGNFEPLMIAIVFIFLVHRLWELRGTLKILEWQGSCTLCFRKRTWLQGIFCANFYWKLGGYSPCERIWCGQCYTSSQEVSSHVKTPQDSVEGEENVPKRRRD